MAGPARTTTKFTQSTSRHLSDTPSSLADSFLQDSQSRVSYSLTDCKRYGLGLTITSTLLMNDMNLVDSAHYCHCNIHGGFRHNRKCQENTAAHLPEVALDIQLWRSLSPTEPHVKGRYCWFQDTPQNQGFLQCYDCRISHHKLLLT